MSRKDELYHYGVKGMKWGKRKAIREYLDAKKSSGAGGSMSGKAEIAEARGNRLWRKVYEQFSDTAFA